MSISRKLLNEGESVVVSMRTHVKALLGPALLLIVVAALAGFLATLPSGDLSVVLQAVIWGVAALVVVWWVVRPFLRWLTTTYTLTTRRLITRSGIVTRRGHDIPLIRVSDVAYERGLLDRLLGCGTLVVSVASDQGRVLLHDIPQIEQVHLRMSELLYDNATGRDDSESEDRGGTQRVDDGT